MDILNENDMLLISKRKFKDRGTEVIYSNAPLRFKVLEFLQKNKNVNEQDLLNYINRVTEDLGRKPSSKWISNNKKYLNVKVDDTGSKSYTLNSRGSQVLNTHLKFEAFKQQVGKNAVEYDRGQRKSIKDKIDFDDLLSGGTYKPIKEVKLATTYVYSNVVMRNKILEFINNKGNVSLPELKEFFNNLSENIGKTPSSSYLSQNKHLIDRKLNKNGTSIYSLTTMGKQVLKNTQNLN